MSKHILSIVFFITILSFPIGTTFAQTDNCYPFCNLQKFEQGMTTEKEDKPVDENINTGNNLNNLPQAQIELEAFPGGNLNISQLPGFKRSMGSYYFSGGNTSVIEQFEESNNVNEIGFGIQKAEASETNTLENNIADTSNKDTTSPNQLENKTSIKDTILNNSRISLQQAKDNFKQVQEFNFEDSTNSEINNLSNSLQAQINTIEGSNYNTQNHQTTNSNSNLPQSGGMHFSMILFSLILTSAFCGAFALKRMIRA